MTTPTTKARIDTDRTAKPKTRPLATIAREIRADWTKVYFGAVPYLDAMSNMGSIEEDFGADPGREIVVYFLANAEGWRGDVARRVKAELKGMLAAR